LDLPPEGEPRLGWAESPGYEKMQYTILGIIFSEAKRKWIKYRRCTRTFSK
jgi:hypothetical protein